MANTVDPILSKILARAMLILRRRATMIQLVNTDFSTEGMEFGKTVDVPVDDTESVATDVVPSNTPPVPSDRTHKLVQIQLDKWKHKDFHLTDKEMLEIDRSKNFVPMAMASAVAALADQVNADIFNEGLGFYGYVGDAGTTPFGSTGSLAGTLGAIVPRKALNAQRAPREDRRMVLDFDAEAAALALPALSDVEKVGEQGAKIRGEIGERFGFRFFADDNVPRHTAGSITTGLIAKAATAQAIGDQTIICTTAASSGACALVAGDIITFAGHAQTYVLTAAATQASASTDVTLNISPGLVVAMAGSEAVTVKASHVLNLAFHKDAIAFVNRPLMTTKIERGTRQMTTMQDPVTGLVVRLELINEYKQMVWDLDILYGVKLIRPQLGVRIAG